MKPLSDKLVANLQADMRAPDLSGTRYGLVRYLARGGMGSVWLVEDTVLQRVVALKLLDFPSDTGNLGVRLLQEVRILAGLEHPGIVPVHDAGTLADGRPFYCMKFVEGRTLAEYVADKSLPERLRLLERIAEPVDFAHSRGFIHRDLKPDNIMIGAFGEVLVMDWGLARAIAGAARETDQLADAKNPAKGGPPVTGAGSVLGTPGYMSPEQAHGENTIDHRTDIFSLGAILWFVLTGSAPGALPAGEASVPRPLRAICAKAMAPKPSSRYQSAAQMTDDIANCLRGEPVSAYPESLLERAGRVYQRHSTAIVLVAAYLLMRLLYILFARR